MRFRAYGHPNVRATHQLTLEFTRDKELTIRGDCIIGVGADFCLDEIKELLGAERIRLIICVGNERRVVLAKPNPGFCSDHEIVVRMGAFLSERTLGTEADKAAKDFRDLVDQLKDPKQEIVVEIEPA